MKIVIAVNTAWNLVNFRSGIIRAFIENGYDVVAIAPPDEYVGALERLGCRYVSVKMDRNGKNAISDLFLFFRLIRVLREERPMAFLAYTIKMNIYGSLASNLLGIPVVNNIAGLGHVFGRENLLTFFVKNLYRFSLRKSEKVFFQNEDDLRLFVDENIVKKEKSDRLPGSGVDLTKFSPNSDAFNHAGVDSARPNSDEKSLHFLFVGRLLWDKGVGEYVEAARRIRKDYKGVTFSLLGFLDDQNSSAVTRVQMDDWISEGVIDYLGETNDVRGFFKESDCIVLPSYYREGVPRTLLEAAAMGLPVITTNSVGCKEVVDHGVNGFLCRPRDVADLVDKLSTFIGLSSADRAKMGCMSRAKAVAEFDEDIVVDKYLVAVKEIFLLSSDVQ